MYSVHGTTQNVQSYTYAFCSPMYPSVPSPIYIRSILSSAIYLHTAVPHTFCNDTMSCTLQSYLNTLQSYLYTQQFHMHSANIHVLCSTIYIHSIPYANTLKCYLCTLSSSTRTLQTHMYTTVLSIYTQQFHIRSAIIQCHVLCSPIFIYSACYIAYSTHSAVMYAPIVKCTHLFSSRNLSLPSVRRHTPLPEMVCSLMVTSPRPPWYHRPCQSFGKEHREPPATKTHLDYNMYIPRLAHHQACQEILPYTF